MFNLRRGPSWIVLTGLWGSCLSADTSGFTKWWPRFQSAVAKHDAKAVAQGAHFPLGWENGATRQIKTAAELEGRFDFYFASEIRRIVANRIPERLPNGIYSITWKARGNEYSLYFKPGVNADFVLDGLTEGPP